MNVVNKSTWNVFIGYITSSDSGGSSNDTFIVNDDSSDDIAIVGDVDSTLSILNRLDEGSDGDFSYANAISSGVSERLKCSL